MADSIKIGRHVALIFSGLVFEFLVMWTTPVEAVGHVSIANAFHSAIQITCNSDRQDRQTHKADVNEIYSFPFEEAYNKFWDCLIYNRSEQPPIRNATFRMWADMTHGGAQLWGCTNCNWSVDERGVLFLLDCVWRFMYHWPWVSASNPITKFNGCAGEQWSSQVNLDKETSNWRSNTS